MQEKGIWGTLSSGERIPLDTEAVREEVRKGIDQKTVFVLFGELPGRWITGFEGVRLPVDRKADEVARALGWENLIVKKDQRLYFP